MSYLMNSSEILQTIQMIDQQHLDVRTVTMGINLLDCCDRDLKRCCERIYDKICQKAELPARSIARQRHLASISSVVFLLSPTKASPRATSV